jgi:CDP-glycerol glycerophosphotransferase (TagB/SpsB family)
MHPGERGGISMLVDAFSTHKQLHFSYDNIITALVIKNNKRETVLNDLSSNSLYDSFCEMPRGVYYVYGQDEKEQYHQIKYGIQKTWVRVLLDENNALKISQDKEGYLKIKKETHNKNSRIKMYKTVVNDITILKEKITISGTSNILHRPDNELNNRNFYVVLHKFPSQNKLFFPVQSVTEEGEWTCEITADKADELHISNSRVCFYEEIDLKYYGSYCYFKEEKYIEWSTHSKKISFFTSNNYRLDGKIEEKKKKAELINIEAKNKDISVKLRLENANEQSSFVLKVGNNTIPLQYELKDATFKIVIPFDKIQDLYYLTNGNISCYLYMQNSVEMYKITLPYFVNQAHFPVNYFTDDRSIITYYISAVSSVFLLKLQKPRYLRRIKKAAIDGNKLQISGNVLLKNISSFDPVYDQVNLLITERDTKQTFIEPLQLSIDKRFPIPYRQKHLNYDKNKFDVELDMIDIHNKIGVGIWDFYLSVNKDYLDFDSRKLGYEFYTYKKDLDLGVVKTENDLLARLSLTPRGNLKLQLAETQHQESVNKKNSREVWIIGERPDTAQDNGFHFFKYMRQQHKADVDVYYAIQKDSLDLRNIEELGNVVEIGSPQHYEVAMKADAYIGTHDIEYFIPIEIDRLNKTAKRVFLQHGVMGRKNAEYHKYYYNDPFDLVITSSDKEKELFHSHFKYEKSEIAVTGLSRFDYLYKRTFIDQTRKQRQILVMPTWREWISDKEDFTTTEYYMRYASLLNNEELKILLKENQVKLVFYPHYRMQPYIDNFLSMEDDMIRIEKLGEKDVQELLIESDAMVTDFSSVSFDMTFMNKPVIFYHFDFKRFFKNGLLRKKQETFLGEIVHTERDIVQAISHVIQNNFEQDSSVGASKDEIIKYTDNRNSERIYEAILQTRASSSGIRVPLFNMKGYIKKKIKNIVKYSPLLYVYRILKRSKRVLTGIRKWIK